MTRLSVSNVSPLSHRFYRIVVCISLTSITQPPLLKLMYVCATTFIENLAILPPRVSGISSPIAQQLEKKRLGGRRHKMTTAKDKDSDTSRQRVVNE